MKWLAFLTAGFAVVAGSGVSLATAPVPGHAGAIWSTADCGKEGLTLLANARLALVIEGEGPATSVAVVPAEWVGQSIMLRVKGEAHERVLHLDDLKRCDGLPGATSLLLADVAAVFGGLDDIIGSCRARGEITRHCFEQGIGLADTSGNRVLSRAELRQAMRAASFFIAYRGVAAEQENPFVSMEKLMIAQLAASVLSPFVVGFLIDSYDSDGDDSVSTDELLRGREPDRAVRDILADLIAKAPPAVVSMLLKSMPDFPLPTDRDVNSRAVPPAELDRRRR